MKCISIDIIKKKNTEVIEWKTKTDIKKFISNIRPPGTESRYIPVSVLVTMIKDYEEIYFEAVTSNNEVTPVKIWFSEKKIENIILDQSRDAI